MVLVSGAAFGMSYKYEPYAHYFWKRVKRLLFPCWIFLTVYFLVLCIIKSMGHPMDLLNKKTVLSSYFLLSGVGYVWIIRVFLLVAAVAPFVYRFEAQTSTHRRFFLILGTVYVDYEVLLFL